MCLVISFIPIAMISGFAGVRDRQRVSCVNFVITLGVSYVSSYMIPSRCEIDKKH